MPAPKEILDLVARFELHLDAYKSGQYNETQLRRDFLDPFFKALGWDIDNSSGHAEAYRDVIHEDAVRIGDAVKAPDYSFRVGGLRKFFLEAKKPSVHIKEDIAPAFQLRRYAWSAKLPLSVLSDFEEFAIYDCRLKPDRTDKASIGRVFYCTYREFAEKWDQIASIFSKESILKGSFDKFAESNKSKRGTTEVDAAFLEEIENWRSDLASNLALRNKSLTQRELNFAVQRIIDRIIFLRICEDRGIETYKRLHSLTEKAGIYGRLCERFREADDRYNSGLFHFKAGKDRHEPPDSVTLGLDVDDKLLRDMLRGLYYPDSPYEFSVLSADILGQVYEQFLGKVIELTEGHRAKIEAKPEVRKAGGVFYTPTYIVDYIVRETVGKLVKDCGGEPAIEGKTLDADAARKILTRVSKLKIVDPACGSGSFLIGAYQFLLDWHLRFYLATNPSHWANEKVVKTGSKGKHPFLVPARNASWQLSIAERKRILLNNIYGVDIDSQAVEVTKLSLLLKVLEGEAVQTQMTLGLLDRVLPDLGDNIKCGNSLIGHDFFQQGELPDFTEEDNYRLNAFDWEAEFPEVFGDGGFDAVIGNPPYDVMEKERLGSSWPHELLAEYATKKPSYAPALGGKLNLFRFFIVRSIELVRDQGRIGMIVPMSILADISCAVTRKHLLLNTLQLKADCFPQKDNAKRRIFRDAKLSTMIFSGSRARSVKKQSAQIRIRVFPWNSFDDPCREAAVRFLDSALLDPDNLPIPLVDEAQWKLCIRLHSSPRCKRLGELTQFSVTRGEINQTIYRRYITQDRNHSRLLKGVEVARFRENRELKQGFREWFDEESYLADAQPKPIVAKRRIATQRITGVDERLRVVATIVDPPTYFADSTNSIAVEAESRYSLEYMVGLLNSKLMQWRFKLTSTNNNVGTNELQTLPVATIDFGKVEEAQEHDQMERLVDDLMGLFRQLSSAKTPQERIGLQRQITATDAQIDRLVYQLYGLTESEIALVEGRSVEGSASAPTEPEASV